MKTLSNILVAVVGLATIPGCSRQTAQPAHTTDLTSRAPARPTPEELIPDTTPNSDLSTTSNAGGPASTAYSKAELTQKAIGLSKSELIALLGRPDSTGGSSGAEAFFYNFASGPDHGWYITDESAAGRYQGDLQIDFSDDERVASVSF